MNKVIILAAGKGTRMKSDVPKVLSPINGRPMIEYLVKSVLSLNFVFPPVIVVSPENKEAISDALRSYNLQYAIQSEQLGTGHAVLSAKDFVEEDIKKVVILYGDHPFYRQESIDRFVKNHKTAVSMMTVDVDNFDDWRQNFYHWGRIIEDNGQIKEIVEFKDASEEIKKIRKLNPALFCFDKQWLFENINNLKNNNNQKEYYLTDLIKMAFEQKISIASSSVDPAEAIGVNSPEELLIARGLVKNFNF